MSDNILDKKIGNVDTERLSPKQVVCVEIKIEDQKKKTGELVGKMTHICVKHPDKEEVLDISKCIFIDNKAVKESGLWYNEDKNGDILKGSALASVLKHYKCNSLRDLLNKTLETELNVAGYLAIKAYG